MDSHSKIEQLSKNTIYGVEIFREDSYILLDLGFHVAPL